MNLGKTSVRSTLGQGKLNSIMLVKMNTPQAGFLPKSTSLAIAKRFLAAKNRRLKKTKYDDAIFNDDNAAVLATDTVSGEHGSFNPKKRLRKMKKATASSEDVNKNDVVMQTK